MWCSLCIPSLFFFSLCCTLRILTHFAEYLSVFARVKTERLINIFSRSSNFLWLCPRPFTLCEPHRVCTNTWPCSTYWHTCNLFIRQTHSVSPVSACRASLQLSRLWQSCFSMQRVWVSRGEEETWKWVKAFGRRPQCRARSYSAVLALCPSITVYHFTRTHPERSCWGKVIPGWDACKSRSHCKAQWVCYFLKFVSM